MKTQWTSGPWATPPMSQCSSDIGITTNPANGQCQIVAMVVVDEDYPQEDVEQCANARLIAAAPEMAALLEDIADQLDRADTDEECGKAANDIEPKVCALLAKIKGQ